MRTLLLATLAVSLIACGKKTDDSSASSAAKPAAPAGAPAAPAAPAAAPGAPAAPSGPYTPADLWKAAAGASRLDDIYQAKIGVKGTITKVVDDPVGEYKVSLDAGGGNTVIVTYLDGGGAARKAKLAAGQPLEVKNCSLTKPEATTLTLRDCQ